MTEAPFDGDVAVKAWIMRLIDDAHPALAELADDAVRPERGAGGERHGKAEYTVGRTGLSQRLSFKHRGGLDGERRATCHSAAATRRRDSSAPTTVVAYGSPGIRA